MNSLIEQLISFKDDKKALISIYCQLEFWQFPKEFKTEFMPYWWNPYEAMNSEQEYKRFGFIDVLQDFIKTNIKTDELNEAMEKYTALMMEINSESRSN